MVVTAGSMVLGFSFFGTEVLPVPPAHPESVSTNALESFSAQARVTRRVASLYRAQAAASIEDGSNSGPS